VALQRFVLLDNQEPAVEVEDDMLKMIDSEIPTRWLE